MKSSSVPRTISLFIGIILFQSHLDKKGLSLNSLISRKPFRIHNTLPFRPWLIGVISHTSGPLFTRVSHQSEILNIGRNSRNPISYCIWSFFILMNRQPPYTRRILIGIGKKTNSAAEKYPMSYLYFHSRWSQKLWKRQAKTYP